MLVRKLVTAVTLSVLLYFPIVIQANEPAPLQVKILSNGERIIVEEGRLEPNSVGSFTIRKYAANSEFPYDRFLIGTVVARDGVLSKVDEIEYQEKPTLLIISRSVGTGGYLNATLIDLKDLRVIRQFNGLDGDTSLAQLKKHISN